MSNVNVTLEAFNYAIGRYGDNATIKNVAKANGTDEAFVISEIYKQKQKNPCPKEIQHYCGVRLHKQEGVDYKCDNKKCHRHTDAIHGACGLTPNTYETDVINTPKHKKVTYFVDKDLKITDVKYHDK